MLNWNENKLHQRKYIRSGWHSSANPLTEFSDQKCLKTVKSHVCSYLLWVYLTCPCPAVDYYTAQMSKSLRSPNPKHRTWPKSDRRRCRLASPSWSTSSSSATQPSHPVPATEHSFSTGKDIFSANVHEGQPASRWDDGEEAEEARVNA